MEKPMTVCFCLVRRSATIEFLCLQARIIFSAMITWEMSFCWIFDASKIWHLMHGGWTLEIIVLAILQQLRGKKNGLPAQSQEKKRQMIGS